MARPTANWLFRVQDSTGTWHRFTFSGRPFVNQDAAELYRPFLLHQPKWSAAMPGPHPGLRGGIAAESFGSVAVDNRKGADGTRPLDALKSLSFRRQAWEAYLAEGWPTPAQDLTDAAWGNPVVSGVVSRMSIETDRLVFALQDPLLEIDKPLSIPRFRGYGSSVVRLASTGVVDFGDIYDLTGSFEREIAVRFDSGDLTKTNQNLLQKRNAGNTKGFRLFANELGSKGLRVDLFELGVTLTSASNVLSEDSDWHMVTFGWSSEATRAYLYLDGDLLVENLSASGSLTGITETMQVGSIGSCTCYVTELRVWSKARTTAEIRSTHDAAQLQAETPGLEEYWRQGSGTTWQAALSTPTNDGTASGTVTFVYGAEGQAEQARRTKPLARGVVNGVAGEMGDPGSRTIHLSSGDALASSPGTSVYSQADELTLTTHFTRDNAAGTITVTTLPNGDDGDIRAHIRVPSGTVGYDDLISFFLFDSGVGPLAAARQASPFIRGSDPQEVASHYLPSMDDPPQAPDVLEELLLGADAVLTFDASRAAELVRVPGDPFAVADATTLLERVDFDAEGITLLEFIEPYSEQTVWFDRNVSGAMDRGDIASAADAVDRAFFLRDHDQEIIRADEDWITAHPEADPAPPLEAHLIERLGAIATATRRQQLTALGISGLRRVEIKLTRKVTEAYRLGGNLMVYSTEQGYPAGKPFAVTSISFQSNPWGTVQAVEVPFLRISPSAFEESSELSGTPAISGLAADPTKSVVGTIGYAALGDEFRVSFPALSPAGSGECWFRYRTKGFNQTPSVTAIDLYESGSLVRALQPVVIATNDAWNTTFRSNFPSVVYGAKFDLSELADTTGADIEVRIQDAATSNSPQSLDLIWRPA